MEFINNIIISNEAPKDTGALWLRPTDKKLLWFPKRFGYVKTTDICDNWQILGDLGLIFSLADKVKELEEKVYELTVLSQRAVYKKETNKN